jgi:Outer membrane protein beta-barrel domain
LGVRAARAQLDRRDGMTMRTFAKVSVVALALVALGASPALAQGIGTGVKGGWLFSDLTAEGADFDSRNGYQVGLFFGGNRTGLLGVMAEVNYGEKGGTAPNNDNNHYDIQFVSVPVLLRVNAGSRSLSGVSVYGIVGPQFDWLISQKVFIGDEEFDISDDTKGYETSLVVGGGVELSRFILELRYTKGLVSIAKEFIPILDNTSELKSNAFAILFGFRFS